MPTTAPQQQNESVPALTTDQLAERFGVSTKTISRWREDGLVSFRFVSDNRQRVGFRESAIQQFIGDHPERIRRGTQFSRLTDLQRNRIIEKARTLADTGLFPAEVIKNLAQETGRSLETIRYTLKRYNQAYPERAIFPDHGEPPREETKQKIIDRFRQGESIAQLSQRFCRTKAILRRIVREMQVRWISELPLDYMPNEEFAKARLGPAILGPMPVAESALIRPPAGLSAYWTALYDVPLLTKEQEVHLFRKMNYAKYRAAELRDRLNGQPTMGTMSRIERYYGQSVAARNELIRRNLRLVVSIAKRSVGQFHDIYELISDGNMTLARAVEKFDYGRGNKFSTYASWALQKNYARSIPAGYRQLERFRTGCEDILFGVLARSNNESELEAIQLERELQVKKILRQLSERERTVIMHRFGLCGEAPRTLKETGVTLGVSKERVRQIEARALSKLRLAARTGDILDPVYS